MSGQHQDNYANVLRNILIYRSDSLKVSIEKADLKICICNIKNVSTVEYQLSEVALLSIILPIVDILVLDFCQHLMN